MYSCEGFCPCCENVVTFASETDWYRDYLTCPVCEALVRDRAVALVLTETVPHWATLKVHDIAPTPRGVSLKLRKAASYTPSNFNASHPRGVTIDGYRNEDVEAQTFPDGVFDIVVSLDVMEHVFHPSRAYNEIARTLQRGGYYIHAFPIRKWQVDAAVRRAELSPTGAIRHLVSEPEYHGNPIDAHGSLVTFDYGYDIAKQIAEWAPFDVRALRFWDQQHGIIGEYTEVFVCRKRG